jgi:hypothetical protein
MAMGSDMGWYLVVSLWGLAAGGVCFFDCAYRKVIRPKTYVGNVLLTICNGRALLPTATHGHTQESRKAYFELFISCLLDDICSGHYCRQVYCSQ